MMKNINDLSMTTCRICEKQFLRDECYYSSDDENLQYPTCEDCTNFMRVVASSHVNESDSLAKN